MVVFWCYVFKFKCFPLIIFNRKWQQVGDLVEATKICAPFIFALAAIGGIVVFLYYNEDLE